MAAYKRGNGNGPGTTRWRRGDGAVAAGRLRGDGTAAARVYSETVRRAAASACVGTVTLDVIIFVASKLIALTKSDTIACHTCAPLIKVFVSKLTVMKAFQNPLFHEI